MGVVTFSTNDARLNFQCLVLDHDDTTVDSTATVHYPAFVEYMKLHHPEINLSLEQYFEANFDPGVVALFTDICGMTVDEMHDEERFWNAYVKAHTPKAYPGMRELMLRQKSLGGLVCVVSHSYTENILRDYRENDLPKPDLIFGWESPPAQRKPSPWPLEQIMKTFSLSPSQLLVVDDLKPGYDMSRAAGVPFAAAGWANDIPRIETFMRQNCDRYCKTVADLETILFR